MTTQRASDGCGCGGATATGTPVPVKSGDCGCGCGGTCGCSTCAPEGYTRPRFFAGQLLTEEDLDLLTSYATSKNRLHNRSFFGEGAVCGLEVVCDPCGDGHVTVRPGYALDCCGNDIVVPCAQQLDINAMVRDLRTSMLGVDCGDPCADTTAKQAPPPPQKAEPSDEPRAAEYAATALGTVRPIQTPAERPEVEVVPLRRHYSLYVRYCEEATDPVAPYATDEPCNGSACEPSRIREGFKFELRCEAERPRPDDMFIRIYACLRDVWELEERGRRVWMWNDLRESMASAVSAAMAARPEAEFTAEDAAALKESVDRLQTIDTSQLDDEGVRSALDEIRRLVMTTVRLNTLPAEKRDEALADDELRTAAEAAPLLADRLADELKPFVARALDNPIDRRSAEALLSEGLQWLDPDLTQDERNDIRNYLAGEGRPMTTDLVRLYAGNLEEIREWLLDRIDKSPLRTDCTLRRDVEAIEITRPLYERRLELMHVRSTQTAGSALAAALVRYVYGCICSALIPPCRGCDDPAVLLANVEVEECEVTYICNLERTIPLTGTALAWWLPVQELAWLLDKVCCELPRKPLRPAPKRVPKSDDFKIHKVFRLEPTGAVFSRQPQEARIEPLEGVLRAAGVPETMTDRVKTAVENVSTLRTLALPTLPAPKIAPRDLADALHDAAARAVVADAVRSVAPEVISEPARATAATVAAATVVEAGREDAQRLAKLEARLADVTAVKRDLTTLKRKAADLTKANADLRRRNEALEKRLGKLDGGG
jgi:hypothetical protein